MERSNRNAAEIDSGKGLREGPLSLNGTEYFNEVNTESLAGSLRRVGIQDVTISID